MPDKQAVVDLLYTPQPKEKTIKKPVLKENIVETPQDLTPILERLDKMEQQLEEAKNQRTLIISLLNSKLDLDKQEAELMDIIKAKIEASK